MSGTSEDTRGAKRSRQTCLNCRRKKVKCHGEHPSCSFCARLLQECVYPGRPWTEASDRLSNISGDSMRFIGNNIDYNGLASGMMLIESQLNTGDPKKTSAENGLEVIDMDNLSSPLNWRFPTSSSHNEPPLSLTTLQGHDQPVTQTTFSVATLPPSEVLLSTVDLYFDYCHNQPYCFFHEETFRHQLSNKQLPKYLIFAVLAMALRFSLDPFYQNNHHHTAAKYASEAWKEVVRQSFDYDEGLDYRLVQAATLLSLHDFTACKHGTAWIKIGVAVSMAQSLRLMIEPATTLPFSAQEERRRTLWSIYLLDKMATCGRDRPSLFLDRTIQLQLPCSEQSFKTSTLEQVVTLGGFHDLDDIQISNLEPFAISIVLASLLSQAANYAFQHNKTGGQKPPWDHVSEYQIICSQLTRLETFFDSYGDIQKHILDNLLPHHENAVQITDGFIFSYILYQLCYCLLQHPFLLRRRLESYDMRIPTSFLAQAIASCSSHAQELTRTLRNARRARYKVSATIFSYCALVAGSIHSLFQHSADELTRIKSIESLQGSLAHLKEQAIYWKNSARMVAALVMFSDDSACYSPLLNTSLQRVSLEQADIEKLYALCDYGTMSTLHTIGTPNTSAENAELNDYRNYALMQGNSSTIDLDEFSGHIDGIIPQVFGHTDTGTMLDNLSSLLGEFNAASHSPRDHAWHY